MGRVRLLLPAWLVVLAIGGCASSQDGTGLSATAERCANGQVLTHTDKGWGCTTPNWGGLADKPATFPPSAHSHHWEELLDRPTNIPDGTLPVLTKTGFSDGNSIEFEQDKRIHLKTRQRWITGQGLLSDLIRLQWTADRAKPAISWLDEGGSEKAAVVAHDKANDPLSEDHRHISIEATMDPNGPYAGQLFTRLEIPFDTDRSEIQVHDARLTINGNYLRISNDDGATKELRLCRSYSKGQKPSIYPGGYDSNGVGIGMPDYEAMYSARWAVRSDNVAETGSNSGSDFRIVRFDDNGTAMDAPVTVQRSSGRVGIMTSAPTAALDVNGGLRLRKPMTPTGSSDPTGNTGDWAWDDQFVYVKTSTGWKRSTLTTF